MFRSFSFFWGGEGCVGVWGGGGVSQGHPVEIKVFHFKVVRRTKVVRPTQIVVRIIGLEK